RNVRDSYRVVRGWIARINAFLQENITGMSTVQLFRREALNFARFDEIDRKHRDANIESIFYYAVFYPAIEAVATLASALIIWYGGGGVMSRTLTLGALVAFLQYSQRFFRPISDMSEKFNVLQAAMASSERIFKLLDEPVAIESPALPARRPAPAQGHIVFDGVWFTYNEGLRDGYASAVAERGSTLSVGQKQLLSFARALAFDPRVLILDEATSSVDTETELIIRDALRVLMAGRTTIAIAHRLSTIQDMDKILVLHKGQLRESATHQE